MFLKHSNLVFNAVINCLLVQYLTLSLLGIQILIIIVSSLSFSFLPYFIHSFDMQNILGVCVTGQT